MPTSATPARIPHAGPLIPGLETYCGKKFALGAPTKTVTKMKSTKKELPPKQRDELLAALKARFDANKTRHPGLVWAIRRS